MGQDPDGGAKLMMTCERRRRGGRGRTAFLYRYLLRPTPSLSLALLQNLCLPIHGERNSYPHRATPLVANETFRTGLSVLIVKKTGQGRGDWPSQ